MATNGLTIALGTADIEITDGTNTYGYKYAKGSQVVETRGSAFVGQIATGGTTYQDAEPFKRKVYDNFLGGMGQESDNKTFGGTGVGGDDTKYFYGDCYTLRGGYLLPGMARNLVYNTIAGQMTPISDGADPNAGDEMEVPRGVLPAPLGDGVPAPTSHFVTSAAVTITNVRVLVYLTQTANNRLTVYLQDGATTHTYVNNFSTSITQYTGWKWVTLPLSSGTGSIASGHTVTVTVRDQDTNGSDPYTYYFIVGCYGADDVTNGTNTLLPYFQLMTSATPYKYWANALVKVEQVLNGATYANIAITTNSLFNTAATATAGTAGTSPERTLAGTYTGSIVWNNTLIVAHSAGTDAWTAAAAATNAARTSTSATVTGRSLTAFGGYIYYIGSDNGIYKWDGTFPITATNIVLANKIGQAGSPLRNLFVFRGNLWVTKPEGVYQLYADPAIITTDPGNTPRINQIGEGFPSAHTFNGQFVCLHQGLFYTNYRDRLYQFTPGDAGVQVAVLSLPMPWYRLSYYHYVNGITSDGVNLYVSYNNLGVFAYANQTWHPVTEYYEQISIEGQWSGLTWLPNPTSAPDNLFCGDGRTIVQMPIPTAAAPYTSQIFQNHQNKCGYVIFSAWDGELAELPKYVHSLVLRAVPSGSRYKVVPVAWQYSTSAGFKNLLNKSFWEGPMRDTWNPTFPYGKGTASVVTTQINSGTSTVIANTLAPACWTATDFNNSFYSAEKLAATTTDTTVTPNTTNVLTNPPKFVKTAFILYFWNPTPGQHAASNIGTDLMAVDSLVVKYLPPLDYIASYQVQVDLRAETIKRTNDQIDADAEQLRQWTGAHQPVQVTMKLTRSSTKTFLAFLQNPTTTYGRASEQSNSGGLIIKGKALTIISVQAEYASV